MFQICYLFYGIVENSNLQATGYNQLLFLFYTHTTERVTGFKI